MPQCIDRQRLAFAVSVCLCAASVRVKEKEELEENLEGSKEHGEKAPGAKRRRV